MKKDDSILAFFCGNNEVYNHSYFKKFPKDTPRGYGVEVCIYLVGNNIDAYYKDVVQKVSQKYIVTPLQVKPWGSKDFRMIDPFGYYLCIREPGNILHK